jgi:hypothetical protein
MVALLFLANIYDPVGTLRVKYVVSVMAGLVAIWTLGRLDMTAAELFAGLLLFVAWPTWAFLYGSMRNGDPFVGVTQVTPFLFALPLASLLTRVDARGTLRVFYACIFSLALVGIVCFGLVVLFPGSGVGSRVFDLLSTLHEKEGFFGTKSFGDTQAPQFYFGSTLFLVPASVYYLFRSKTIYAALAFLALGLAWSKSGIAIVLVFGAIHFVYYLKEGISSSDSGTSKRRGVYLRALLPIGVLAAVVVSFLLVYPDFAKYIADTATGDSETAQLRIGHFRSIMDLFLQHPHYLITGQGVGIPFYSLGESDYVQSIEIEHLDAIRKFGLPWFLGYTAVAFWSAWRLIRARDVELRASGFALLSMYLAAGTNPLLITPLFIILLTLCYFAQRPRAHASASQHLIDNLQRV